MSKSIKIQTVCFTDSRQLQDSLCSTCPVLDKKLREKREILQDMIEKKEIHSVNWITTDKQIANCLTKRGASPDLFLKVLSCVKIKLNSYCCVKNKNFQNSNLHINNVDNRPNQNKH